VRLARIAIVGVIVAALSGCLGTVAVTPGEPSASPAAGASEATGDPVIDSAMLPLLTADQVCALMTAAEAVALLGSPLEQTPSGQAAGGQDTDCVYQDAEIVVAGTYIKVEINRLGFSGQATLINLHRGAHTLKVGGFEAIGADAQKDPVIEEAVLSVKLAKEAKDPALWIEAPTSAIAEQAAVLILSRLAAPH
jgi:hypothetical protein